jgi:hypothetical protein|tara:strand:- start:74 stop:346 length:273 start_codon:yes stop_codon:yes gene_type:complete
MANMRYFNLKALDNVRVRNLDVNSNVRRVFDPMHNDLSNWGSITEANSNFPQHNFGAGNRGSFLTNFMDLGSVADTVRFDGGNYNFGTIA